MHSFLIEARHNLRLALPLIAAQLAAIGMGVTDTIMAGHINPQALAAVAVGSNFNMVPLVFFSGLFMSASAIVAKRRGAGRANHTVGAFTRSLLLLALGFGLLWGVAMWFLAAPLLSVLHLTASTEQLALSYLQCFGFTGVGLCLWFCLRYCAEGLGDTKAVMWVALFGLVLNALLNWLLIYGRGPIPAMGVKGSAIASVIACFAMPMAMLVCYQIMPKLREAQLFASKQIETGGIAQTLKLGLPIGVIMLAEAGLFIGVSMLMARIGEATVAAYQIAINLAALLFMIPVGLSLATTVRVAYFAGAQQPQAARRAGLVGIGLGLGNALINATFMVSLSWLIVKAYTSDMSIAKQAVHFLMLAAAFQIFDGVQATANGALRGLHDTRFPLAITLIAYWLLGMPVAWWLGFHTSLGADGLWWGLSTGLAAAAFGLTLRFILVSRTAAKPA